MVNSLEFASDVRDEDGKSTERVYSFAFNATGLRTLTLLSQIINLSPTARSRPRTKRLHKGLNRLQPLIHKSEGAFVADHDI